MTKIGVFDSGVGGLTVLKSLRKELPNNHYVYVGDNINNPYGNKTKKELHAISTRIIDYFIKRNIKTIVVACNTISSNNLDDLEIEYPNIKFFGVIKSTVNEVLKKEPKELLIIATNKTIESNCYEKSIKMIAKSMKIVNLKTPLLVPIIENNNQNIEEVLYKYLKPYKKIDTILLGCTHYELITDNIKKIFYGKIISSSNCVVKEVKKYLKNLPKELPKTEIYTTGDLKKFNEIAKTIIKEKAKKIEL